MDLFGEINPDRIRFKRLFVNEKPFELYQKLQSKYKYAFILESLTGPKEMSEMSVIGFDPMLIITANEGKLAITDYDGNEEKYEVTEPMEQIRKLIPIVKDDTFRYLGGAVGYVSYDAVRYWENIPMKHVRTGYPDIEFGIYTDGILFNHIDNRVYYFYLDKSRIDDVEFDDATNDSFIYNEPTRNVNEDKFGKMVDRAKEYIYDGNIYQVVLCKRFNFNIEGNPILVYEKLREINPSPYMYCLKMADRSIIGSSPEMLVRVNASNIETFPIAGTRATSVHPEKNMQLREDMLNDEKELAEHTMLVDLARNDIGRVCRWGTVKVDQLMTVKEFSHVQHLVSHVVGKLKNNYDSYDAFKSVFPAGTVSGAPKVRAMEIIDELETDARGPYAGALGYFSLNGNCDFAIVIRSMFVNSNKAFIQAGAGIVADSDPEKEWMETEHKVNALMEALMRASK